MKGSETALAEERVLVLVPTGQDATLARAMLEQAGIAATVYAGAVELGRELEAGAGAVLLAEEALIGPARSRLLAALNRQPPWSDIPLVVFANLRESDRSALEALGNVTILERPIRIATLVSAMRAALRARRRQYEVRELLQRLEQTDRRKDEFLAMLGHELRNPLAAISNALQVLDQTGSPAAGPVRQRAIIARQVRHLTHLVDDLLDVSRINSGKISLEPQPLDLKELVEQCLQSHGTAVAAQRHGVSITVKAEPVSVRGDPVRLEQVVANLLSNAVKYTPPGGRVRVLVHREGDEGVIRVQDTGVGIEPDVLPHIFEPFTQAKGTLDRSRGGLGLGLALVRRLVAMHGGSVAVDSAGPGRGSEFMARLPLLTTGRPEPGNRTPARAKQAPATGAHLRSSAPGPWRASPGSKQIVVIEDNADARETLRDLLELGGHRVLMAEDGTDGLQKILTLQPDVAIIDIGLPGLDGYQVARRVRATPHARSIFLIALTGYGQPEDRQRALEAGFDAHMVKPVNLEELFRLLTVAPAGTPS